MHQSEQRFNDERDEVISKFKSDFLAGYYNHNPLFRTCAEMLFRGADPYLIIQELIVNCDKISKEILKLRMDNIVNTKI